MQLTGLLAEIPDQWRLFFELLASTGLRVSETIALRRHDLSSIALLYGHLIDAELAPPLELNTEL